MPDAKRRKKRRKRRDPAYKMQQGPVASGSRISKDKDILIFMQEAELLLNGVNIFIPGIIDEYRYLLKILPERVTKEAFIDNVNYKIKKRKWAFVQSRKEVWLEKA